MIKELNVFDMKKSDFKNVPYVDAFKTSIEPFDSLVIIPTRHKHESGWLCMEFVACKRGEPVCRLSGRSDVINIDGIGGYGLTKNFNLGMVEVKGWSIDCLPCGYLNLWCNKMLEVGSTLSNFEIYG